MNGGTRMSLRSWAIRGMLLAGVAVIATLVWYANAWVSPERIKVEVRKALEAQLDGVEIHIGSAHMRIIGGIAVTDLQLSRIGRAGENPFLSVPSAVIYHDKERLNHGQLVIKKIELNKADLKLERSADGQWNVQGLFKDGPADKLMPTFLIQDAHVHIVDHGPDPLPELSMDIGQLTLINDPINVLAITARGKAKQLGPIKATASLERISNKLSLGLELSEFPLGEAIAGNINRFAPGLASHLAGFKAKASIKADLTYQPTDRNHQWSHHIDVEMTDARYSHSDLPWPVENISAVIHIVDGRMTVENATASVGSAKIKLTAESRANETSQAQKDSSDPLKRFEDHLAALDVNISGLRLDDSLYRALPEAGQQQWRKFSPLGIVDVSYKFSRGRDPGGWKREFVLVPKQITMTYQQFQYPVSNVGGRGVKWTMKNTGDPVTVIDLEGLAAGQLVTIRGQVTGAGDDPGISLRVVGRNVPIDDKLVQAMPEKYSGLVRKFHALGRGDFVAEFVQEQGVNFCEEEFRIDIGDAKICHEDFPYPLEKVKGRILVRTVGIDSKRPVRAGQPNDTITDRNEIIVDNVTAIHQGAAITLKASKQLIPGTRDGKLEVHLGATNCPFDSDLQAIGKVFKIGSVWTTFRPQGKLTFTAYLEVIEHARSGIAPGAGLPFDPRSDLYLRFAFKDATISPTFLPYELTDFGGKLEYRDGRVELYELAARHGESRVSLANGEVRFFSDGVVWANLGGLEVKPLIVDEAFLKALPPKLASGLGEIKLKGRSDLVAKQFTILTPPDLPTTTVVAASSTATTRSTPATVAAQTTSQTPTHLVHADARPTQTGQPAAGSVEPGANLSATPALADQPDPIVYWDLELKLSGGSFDTGVVWDQVFGTLSSVGRYEGTHVGEIRGGFWLDSTAIAGQPLTRISGKYRAAAQLPDSRKHGDFLPTIVEFFDLKGWLFHGTVGGLAQVSLGSPVMFNLWLVAADVNLEKVAKHYNLGQDADLKGIAQAKLSLFNRIDQTSGQTVVEGAGSIDVPTGRMYNLPILLDLVKLSKFETPNKTAFEEAHATFRILGDRVKVDRIDMIGRAVCLGGSGELDTTGSYVNFDFYTIWSTLLAQLINTPVGDLTEFLSKKIVTIKLTRESGVLKYRPVFFTDLTEPAAAVADRLRVRFAQFFGGK